MEGRQEGSAPRPETKDNRRFGASLQSHTSQTVRCRPIYPCARQLGYSQKPVWHGTIVGGRSLGLASAAAHGFQ